MAEATVKVKVKGKSMHTVAECIGPVSALDKALRLALERAYPAIKDTALSDYKVRILDSKRGANSPRPRPDRDERRRGHLGHGRPE